MVNAKERYLKNLKDEEIIAFELHVIDKTISLSGKVIEIIGNEIYKRDIVVQTKRGSVFMIKDKDILWVKTGKRWPKGIYNNLKFN